MLIRPNLSPADNRRIQAMLRANNNSGNLRQQLLDGSPLSAAELEVASAYAPADLLYGSPTLHTLIHTTLPAYW